MVVGSERQPLFSDRLLYKTSQETQSLVNELRVLEVSLWATAGFDRQPSFSDWLLHEDLIETHVLLCL